MSPRLTRHHRAHGCRCFMALYWRALRSGLLDVEVPAGARKRAELAYHQAGATVFDEVAMNSLLTQARALLAATS